MLDHLPERERSPVKQRLRRAWALDDHARALESTNPCESMIEIVRRTQRNVKRCSSGEMALRWTAAEVLEAERQFREIIGYRDLATLVSRSNATTSIAVMPMLLAPRPRSGRHSTRSMVWARSRHKAEAADARFPC